MSQKLQNPYDDILADEEFAIGKGACWAFVIAFLLLITLPPIYRHVSEWRKESAEQWVPVVQAAKTFVPDGKTKFVERIRAFEKRIDDPDLAKWPRQRLQSAATGLFGAGNRKVLLGADGWCFFRPAVQAITGYGPVVLEPMAVSKDPTLGDWIDPATAIMHFASQLHERDIELVLVPVPVKPTVYGDKILGGDVAALTHPDAGLFYDELRGAGVHVIDLLPAFVGGRSTSTDPLFLKQDTHWTSSGMRLAVANVADWLRTTNWFEQGGENFAVEAFEAAHIGDIVQKLDLPEGSSRFSAETQTLQRVLDGAEALATDKDAEIVLLGDSFVNIYDDPSLGFAGAAKSEKLIGAGFAQHLAQALGQRLDVTAMNGQAATGVRREFASRYDDEVRKKKAVIWVIASRDLLYGRSLARENNVKWEHVVFNPENAPASGDGGEPLEIEATLTLKSTLEDPNDVTYRDALIVCEYDVDKVIKGKVEIGATLRVVQWMFKERKYLPTAHFEEGASYRLTLAPWESKKLLQSMNKSDDTLGFGGKTYFLEEGAIVSR